ncbi:neuraminidase-like domain-containing protein, partial [Vibrio parahaemolyticus]
FIDVEMAAVTLASRVQEAIAAVQTFVERALFQLEPTVRLTQAFQQMWSWMSKYRVWQANREVFLYPENWLDPDLRDDATPTF